MKIFKNEPSNMKDLTFADCKMGREKYSKILTNMIENADKGFVLAINNEWGAGKTTFLKMWQNSLENSEYKTIYLNAWENDYEENSMASILGELSSFLEKKKNNKGIKTTFENLKKYSAKLVKHTPVAFTKKLIEKNLGEEFLIEILKAVVDGANDIFFEEIEKYGERKKTISNFKKTLEKYVSQVSPDKPLVFFIDELDRCKPNFAVTMLEQIKHFYSISNIVFVFSIDKEQLGYAIKGAYGNDNINSVEYLRRFIDYEFTLPNSDNFKYYEHLLNDLNIENLWYETSRSQVKYIFDLLLKNFKLSPRKQESIIQHIELLTLTLDFNHKINFNFYTYLIFLKISDIEFYLKIKNKKLNVENLRDKFVEQMLIITDSRVLKDVLFLGINLISEYNRDLDNRMQESISMQLITNNIQLDSPINLSQLDKHNTYKDYIFDTYSAFNTNQGIWNKGIDFYINKTELLDGFTTND